MQVEFRDAHPRSYRAIASSNPLWRRKLSSDCRVEAITIIHVRKSRRSRVSKEDIVSPLHSEPISIRVKWCEMRISSRGSLSLWMENVLKVFLKYFGNISWEQEYLDSILWSRRYSKNISKKCNILLGYFFCLTWWEIILGICKTNVAKKVWSDMRCIIFGVTINFSTF